MAKHKEGQSAERITFFTRERDAEGVPLDSFAYLIWERDTPYVKPGARTATIQLISSEGRMPGQRDYLDPGGTEGVATERAVEALRAMHDPGDFDSRRYG